MNMTTSGSQNPDTFHRMRIRFRKEGDLRWISHRDLVRTVERWLRRARLQLRMSQGFHPKPKMNFPHALALGIAGRDEVLELDLSEEVAPGTLRERLNASAPPGLMITSIEEVGPGQRKAQVKGMWYQFPVPRDRQSEVAEAIEHVMAALHWPLQRRDRPEPIDLKATLSALELRDQTVCFHLRASRQASASPRDVLQALGLAELEQQGCFLTRSTVELVP
jgi:radical SAM-linked protein